MMKEILISFEIVWPLFIDLYNTSMSNAKFEGKNKVFSVLTFSSSHGMNLKHSCPINVYDSKV